jgi:hypothetical protein
MFNQSIKKITGNAILVLCSIALMGTASASGLHHHEGKAMTKKFAGKRYTLMPQKTNGSDVRVYQALSNKAALGKVTTLTLRVDALAAGNSGSIKVLADASLNATGTIEQTLGNANSVFTLSFTPKAEGLHYISVFTEQNGRNSAAQVPVQVGTLVQKPSLNGTVVIDATGEKIIEMKSQ